MSVPIRKITVGIAALQLGAALIAATPREQSFDDDWRFLRADAPGAEEPAFDDSSWRVLDVPHDWSIEDLPPLDEPVPQFPAVTGEWRFHAGDNPAWKDPELNDRYWQEVTLPDTWEHHSNYTEDNAYGWYRRRLEIPDDCKGRDFDLLLGRIDDVDEVWLNGEWIGGTGEFPPNARSAWDVERRYRVPASLVKGDGTDLLAVKVYDIQDQAGIYTAGEKTTRIGPFDPSESAGGSSTGWVVGGTGWYRKHFTVPDGDRKVAVRFDGVYMDADFWINGHSLGNHPYGYTSFEFDLTPHLNPPGEENVLAVRVKNEGQNSRWYSGSGIYRHTWLIQRDPIHVPKNGLFVSTPDVSEEKAVVTIETVVRNASDADADVTVRSQVKNAAGDVIGNAESTIQIPAGGIRAAVETVDVSKPILWSPDSPNLYSAEVELVANGETVDTISTPFGIRKIEVDAENGLRLNGKPLLLKGGCIHHDNGPLGAAAIDRAEERRVELLKANGFNAIRSSHNPPSPAMLDACDRLGMLVIDEAFDQWNEKKNDDDYHRFFDEWAERDIASMVRRDRNHPSVIMWSIGNEIPEQFRAEDTAKRLRDAVLTHDTSRPITQAICNDWGEVTRNWDELSDPAFVNLDVGGYNYLPERYESDHARHPDRVMMGTESYPKDAFDYWALVEKHPYIIGDFVWTAMDYFGEVGIAHANLSNETVGFLESWPWFNAWCGDLDVCGFKKPQSYFRDVVWGRSPIEMAVHAPIPEGLSEEVSAWGWPNELRSWNWPGEEGRPLQVSVYSTCDRVRLLLNGEVIGEESVSPETKLTARFEVPYAPGKLEAQGLVDGKVVAETMLETTGVPKRLVLTADRSDIRADRNDLSYVTVEVQDADGRRVPDADISVKFSVDGVGELAAQASASPNDAQSFTAPARKTYEGRCIAILRPTGDAGEITLQAEAEGLEPATLTIKVR